MTRIGFACIALAASTAACRGNPSPELAPTVGGGPPFSDSRGLRFEGDAGPDGSSYDTSQGPSPDAGSPTAPLSDSLSFTTAFGSVWSCSNGTCADGTIVGETSFEITLSGGSVTNSFTRNGDYCGYDSSTDTAYATYDHVLYQTTGGSTFATPGTAGITSAQQVSFSVVSQKASAAGCTLPSRDGPPTEGLSDTLSFETPWGGVWTCSNGACANATIVSETSSEITLRSGSVTNSFTADGNYCGFNGSTGTAYATYDHVLYQTTGGTAFTTAGTAGITSAQSVSFSVVSQKASAAGCTLPAGDGAPTEWLSDTLSFETPWGGVWTCSNGTCANATFVGETAFEITLRSGSVTNSFTADGNYCGFNGSTGTAYATYDHVLYQTTGGSTFTTAGTAGITSAQQVSFSVVSQEASAAGCTLPSAQ